MSREKLSPITKFINHLGAIGTGVKYLFFPRMTLRYPEEVLELPDGYRGMIIYRKELCISCGLCARICPANAMKMYLEEADEGKKAKRRPGINYTRCIFCGFCVDICPTGAIEHDKTHDIAFESFDEQIQRPKEFEKGPPSARFKKPPKKVKARLDPRRGIIYEPTD